MEDLKILIGLIYKFNLNLIAEHVDTLATNHDGYRTELQLAQLRQQRVLSALLYVLASIQII
jgi:hypothetical protein